MEIREWNLTFGTGVPSNSISGDMAMRGRREGMPRGFSVQSSLLFEQGDISRDMQDK
jgi:hypothetical protein